MALTQTQVSQLYVAIFGRASEGEGNAFWQTQGLSFADTAIAMLETQDSLDYFGGELTDQEFIEFIYNNTLSKTIAEDPEGIQFWVDALSDGYSRGFVVSELVTAATAPENAGAAQDQFLNRVALSNYTADTLYAVPTDYATVLGFSPNGDLVVSDDPSTLVTAKAAVYTEAASAGEIFTLTTDMDVIDLSDSTAIDTVKGLIYDDGVDDNDTFSVGDSITGNGLTTVQVTVVDGNTADYVEMEGIKTLAVKGAGETGTVSFDASTYGTDLTSITLSGMDDLGVDVDNVEFDGEIDLSIAAATTGSISATGMMGDYSVTVDVYNSDSDDVGSSLSVSSVGISVVQGENDTAGLTLSAEDSLTVGDITVSEQGAGSFTLYLDNTVSTATGDATAGDLTIGNISLDLGEDGYFSGSFDNNAYVTVSGDATVGNLTIGNVDINVAAGANQTWWSAEQSATSDKGNATVGDITIGDFTIVADDSASYAMYTSAYNQAYADEGNATVGNITVGNLSLTVGENQNENNWFGLEQSATAETSGDATVGNITVGNIDVVIADQDGSGSASYSFENYAYADEGNATAGNVTVGDITAELGVDATITIDMYNSATVSVSGDATVGDVTVGSIDLVMDSGASFTLEVEANADSTKGNGVIGDITVGDAVATMGISSDFYIGISADIDTASGTMSAVGDITVGNVTLDGSLAISASGSLDIYVDSDGSVGSLTVGDVDVEFQAGSWFEYDMSIFGASLAGATLGAVDVVADSVTYDAYFSADGGDLGAVSIADVSLSADDLDFTSMYLNATGDIADVTIGDITLVAGTSLYLGAGVDITATGDVASVTLGNISIDSANSETFNISVYGDDNVGDVTVGNLSFDAEDFDFAMNVSVDAGADAGNVTVGDVTFSVDAATAAASGHVFVSADANTGDTLGAVTLGDISFSAAQAANLDATAYVSVTAGNNAASMGALTVGDITLSATAENLTATANATTDYASVAVYLVSGASVSVGDIDVTLTNSVDDTANLTGDVFDMATLAVSVTAANDDITVGNITLSAVNNSTGDVLNNGALFDASVALSAGTGDITIGDITVSGGDVDTASAALDNFGNLTGWLSTSGGDVTVGDIDYSGYDATATIDVSGYIGAANITAGAGDTTITVNDTQNTITLGAGDDTVAYAADELSGTTAGEIDTISGFTTGSDTIDFTALNTATMGNTVEVGGSTATYETFLTAAAAAIDFNGYDVFTMTDGTNTYVAVDSDNDSVIDFAIELTGVTSVVTDRKSVV